jgi:exo-beta-1,3-glucanase (GH17 family)/cellulose synthase/poly-beta-1,6-N-acetylglucosamine synthase-like glycosyltransferase
MIALLALLNRPEPEPAWPAKVSGFSFSPLHADEDASQGIYPTVEEIDADLTLLQGKTKAVRFYTVADTMATIPALAAKHNLKVTVGAWLDSRLEMNEPEFERAVELVNSNANVTQFIVGNEVMLRADIPKAELINYLDRARAQVKAPVSTAEPWHVWIRHPDLAEHVDFIAVHMLPYWEGIAIDEAVPYVIDRLNALKEAFPGKRIVVAEVGWPSNGRTRHQASASESNEAIFLRRFLNYAERQHYDYFVMEAFDQPWKQVSEGAVGAYWGVYDVKRQPKFAFDTPVVQTPEWWILALVSVVVASSILLFLFADSHKLKHSGRSFLVIVVYVAASAAVWITYDYTQQYLSFGTVIVGILLLTGMIGVIVVLLAEAHEWAEAHWVREHSRLARPAQLSDEDLPLVSIHIPCYNEPPEMVIETLDALAKLDYHDFEVIVIDNNTKDPAVWQPVQAHCEKLGDRFRFFHEDPLSGFKAGALNFALAQTDEHAEIIAVIDSDYIVDPNWLRDLVPQFQRPSVAIVQAPQDYRDERDNAFKAMCYAEYRGFFYIGMITRNERNAIIQHGTMTLVRRKVLEEVNGWGEWCITEDADLGLRIFEHGYEATYIAKSYGRGVMPDNFADFKKQRYRWAYGAMQILRHHTAELFGRKKSHLTLGQRYHFIAGWLPWIADGMNLLFNVAALCWSVAMLVAPKDVDPPLLVFSLLPLAFFSFKLAKLIYLYRSRVNAGVGQTIAAALAGLALAHTISLAILSGMVTKSMPFIRTPKLASTQRLLKALADSRDEAVLMTAMWAAAAGLFWLHGADTLDLLMWIIVLLVQSIPYCCALIVSIIGVYPKLPAGLVGDSEFGVDKM